MSKKQKSGLDWKTTALHVNYTILYISLPSLHDYDVKMPNFTFCGGHEHKTTIFFFSGLNSTSREYKLLESTPGKFSNIWRIEQEGISAIKFEAAWIHFLSDAFLAVTVIVA